MADKINVLITEEFNPEQLEQLARLSPRLGITSNLVAPTTEISESEWGRCEVLYTFRVLPTPEQAPNLPWIQFHPAGEELLNKIDMQKGY